jgi:hypothetical protein
MKMGLQMRFSDKRVYKAERFSIGIEEQMGKYYLSIPVANSLVDYEEYYEIDKDEFDRISVDAASAAELVLQCRRHEQDDRLIMKPGMDRGVAI